MFPERYSVLVLGEPNAGVFEFCTYLAAFYLRNDQSVVYVEADSSKALVRRQLRSYGIKHEEYEGISLEILDCSTGVSSFDDPARVGNPADLEDLLGKIVMFSQGLVEPVRVILDSLSTLHIYSDKDKVQEFLRSLSDAAKKKGSLTATAHLKMHSTDQIDSLVKICDGLIEMKVDEELGRSIRIGKMQSIDIEPNWVPFNIEPVNGTDGASLIRPKRPR